MSIPTITIRLDFGEGSSSGLSSKISLQGEVPTPMSDLAGAGLTDVTQAELPTPLSLGSIATAAAHQGSVPTPMADIGVGISAAMSVPPVPSLDISTFASGMTDDIPHPEGEPVVVKEGSPDEKISPSKMKM
jgi:hypothetical protein